MQRIQEQYFQHNLAFSNLNDSELLQLCQHLSESSKEKSLTLSGMNWGSDNTDSTEPTTTAKNLGGMIMNNYGLKTIELGGSAGEYDRKFLIEALKHNFDITQFTFPCTEAEHEIIDSILERNKQFRMLQKILINELLLSIGSVNAALKKTLAELRTVNESNATADEVSYLLFHANMQSQVSEPKAFAHIQQTVNMLKRLKGAGLSAGINAIQAAAALNRFDLATALVQLGADVNAYNFRGETALDITVIEGHFEMVKFLCANGAAATRPNKTGRTSFELAIENRRTAIAAHLDPDASFDKKHTYIAKRNLVIGYGVSIFDEINQQRNVHAYDAGGGKREGMALLAEYMQKFAAHRYNHPKLTAIANQFQTSLEMIDATSEELAIKLNSSKTLHTMTGCLSHLTGATIHKLDEQTYELVLADRGLFRSRAPQNTYDDKRPSLQSLTFPAAVLPDMLNIIVSARTEPREQAEKMLFDSIPLIAKSSWKYHANSEQSSLKNGTCFFSNLKSLALHEFHHAFGSSCGKKIYKEFTLFLRTQLLRDYEQFSESEDPYTFIASAKIADKKAKFIKLYA